MQRIGDLLRKCLSGKFFNLTLFSDLRKVPLR